MNQARRQRAGGSTARSCCARLTLAALVLSIPMWTGAARAHAAAGPAIVAPTQELAALRNAHEAFAQPDPDSAPLQLLQAEGPITGERTVLPVLGSDTGPAGVAWLRVRLPGRPNGRTGWIRQAGTVASATSWHLVVETAKRRVTVYDNGRPVRVVKAVVGKPSTPTPHGEFFVEEAVQLESFDIGAPFALALSARSTVLQEFEGGPGQIAIHGLMNVGGIVGTAHSHGCVRLADVVMSWLVVRIGPGVPVTITS